MYLDECKPDNVTVQPPISITVSSGGVAGTETPSPTPSEPVVTPIAPVKKSAEYPSASLNGEWDTIEPELYKQYSVVDVKKTF